MRQGDAAGVRSRMRTGAIMVALTLLASFLLLGLLSKGRPRRIEVVRDDQRLALYSLNGRIALRWNRGFTLPGPDVYLWPPRMLDPDVLDVPTSRDMAASCQHHVLGFGLDYGPPSPGSTQAQLFVVVPSAFVFGVLGAPLCFAAVRHGLGLGRRVRGFEPVGAKWDVPD